MDKNPGQGKLAEMSASEWLAVRDAVAKTVREHSPQSKSHVAIAEGLLRRNWIDVTQVQLDITPQPQADTDDLQRRAED